MDEEPSDRDNPQHGRFLGNITGPMFGNHGGMELRPVASSSPETGQVPMLLRRPASLQVAPIDTGMAADNRLGVGILENANANLFDDQLLPAAFKNMCLSFKEGAPHSAAETGSYASRGGRYPAGHVISSADNTRNGSLKQAFSQGDLVPLSPMTNSAQQMQLKPDAPDAPLGTGMHGSDSVYGSTINLPPASPFQQQILIDGWSRAFAPCQQFDSKFSWHDIHAERYSPMQSQYPYQHMPQVVGSDVNWISSSQNCVTNSCTKSATSPNLRTAIIRHLGHDSSDIYWNGAIFPNGNDNMNSTRGNNYASTIYPDCPCQSGEYCQIHQPDKAKYRYGLRCSPKGVLQNQAMDKIKPKSSPEKILMKTEGVNSIRNIKSGFELSGCVETNQSTGRNGRGHHVNIQRTNSLHFDLQSSHCLSPSEYEYDVSMKSAQFKYNSVDEVVGELNLLARDQNGCRFLQRIFTEGSQDDAQKVFDGVIDHIDELMVDPFGNYLVQKLLEECSDDQRMHIVYEITKIPGQLTAVSCNMHGTRVVQKVIETINTSHLVSMVVSALSPGVITLMMDANGSHVAHRCLQKLSPEYKSFLLNAAVENYFELAKDRQGCCIIQKCIVHANKEQKNRLLYNITSRSLDLAEHQYGNYVIQYILELNITWAIDEILDKLEGHYGYLSMQKCSSNVVEKCLKEAREPKRAKIINELMNDPKLLHILIDQYGNYVIQTALRECEDAAVHAALVEAIRPHAAALRNNMFGKRILSKTCLKHRKF
ncbi:hypothetical protein ACP4OV_020105 [Aristida adscensionis]